MAILRNDTVVKSADGQHSSAIITAANIGSHSIAPNSTYFIGTTQNVFNRASGAQTLTGVSIDGNSGGIYAAGGASIKSSTTGTAYTSHIQIREADGGGSNTSEIYAPALGFHWAGVVASNILMESSGRIAIRNNPGSGYENFIAAIIYAGSSVQAPIFYDSNNTSYYLDPANSGTSLLVAGSIGAGLTTPLHKIQASGLISASDATYNNDSTFIGAILNNDGTNPGLDLRRWNGGAAGTNNHGTTYIATNSAGDTIFYNGLIAANTRATNEKMRIAVNGNVGIGTTSPGSKLDVNGTFRTAINNLTIFNDYIYVSPTENNTLNSAYFTNGIADMWINYAGYNNGNTQFRNFNIGNGRNGVIAWFDGTNKRVSINNNQAASYPLHVVGTAYSDTDFRAPIFYDSANTAYYLDAANSGTSLLVAGNVGIGTTSANNKLTIQEVGTDGTPLIRLVTTSAPNTFSWFMSAMNSSLTAGKNYIGLIGQAESQNNSAYIGFNFQGAGSTSNFLTFGFYQNDNLLNLRASGNVGIGTTSPTQLLDVRGNIKLGGDNSGNYIYYVTDIERTIVRTTRSDVTQEGLLRSDGWGNFTFSNNIGVGLSLGTGYGVGSVGSGIVYANGSVRAPVFYDSNNTAYYLDPASTSVLNALTLNGILTTVSSGTAINFSGQSDSIGYNATAGLGTYIKGTGTTYIYGGGAFFDGTTTRTLLHSNNYGGYSVFSGSVSSGGNITATGYIYTSTYLQTGGNLIYPSGYGATQRLEVSNSANNNWIDGVTIAPGGIVTAPYEMRSPIFYDSNNTAYYLDPASTSNLVGLTVANTITGSISGNAATATTSLRSTIEDTRAAQRTPNDYDDYRASYEFTNAITGLGDWHSAFTLQGWHNGYAAWQIIGPASTSAHENFYLRSGVNTTWNAVRTILHSGNYNSYSPTLTGTGASGTWSINVTGNAGGSSASCTGNAATATILQTARNINGTSFNGSAAITTATWGTARTLTIGSTGKSVDGSAGVSWSLAEIGAAATNQTMFIGTTSVAINRASASQTLTGVSIDGNAATASNATQFGGEANTNFMRGLAGGTEANINNYTDNGFRTVAYTGHGKGLLSFNVGSSIGTVQHEYFYNIPTNGWRVRNKTDNTTWSSWGNIVMTDTNQGALTGTVITTGNSSGLSPTFSNLYAAIFYDAADSTYYLDPANTTLSLKTRSSIVINNASAPNNLAMLNIGYNGGGETRAIDIQGGWSGGENKSITFTHASGSANIVAQINAQHNGPASRLRWGKLYHGGDSSTYTMELISESTTSAYLTVAGSVRAPIFYDSNDTNYYLDAAGTSRLNTTRIGNINVGSGTYLNTITPIGDTNINLSAPSGAFYFDTFPRMPGFYDSDNTAYYINPASNSIVNSLTFDSNITIYKHNDRNLLIQGGGGTDAGLLGRGSSGQFAFQVYGSGSGSYGFLDGAWAGWDIRKVVDGDLFLNDNNTYYLNPGSTTNLNNLTVAGTMTFGTLAYTTSSRRSKNSSNVNVETVTGLVSPTGPTFLEIRGFCPTTMYRTTGDRPAPYGLGFGNGSESGGIMPIGAGDNLQEIMLYGANSGPTTFTFKRQIWEGTAQDPDGSNYYGGAVFSINTGTGAVTASTDIRAPIFYDSANTAYYCDPNGVSNLYGVAIRGDAGITNTDNQIFFWGTGNTTTSAIGFKANGNAFPNPTGAGDGYNTYLTMDTDGRGWVFRRGTGGTDFTAAYTSGWILNNGIWQANASMRSPIFYDSNNTAYYIDAASTSNLVGLTVANTITGSISGNAATATRTSSQSGYPHAGTGMFAFYNWGGTDGGTSAPSASTYTTGISVGSNPGDQAYGFQIANNMWNTGLWTRNYNSSFGAWIRLLDSSNYVGYSAFTSSLTSTVDARAPIFYDSNDTGYYIDAASTSSLNSLISTEVYARNWFRNNDSGEGIYNQATTQHFYSDDVSYWNVASSSGVQGIRFRTGGHGGTVRGYVYANDSNDVGLLNNGGNWRVRVVGGDYTLFDGSSVRAQTFIDSNNTAYYVDPGSTSNLNNLNTVDGNLELYKSQTVDMSNTTTYSTSNYYPVTIPVPTEGCIIQIQNNLNSNVPSWATHGSGFTLNLKWRTNGFGWGTTQIRRIIDQYYELFTNQTICGGITQMGNSSTEVVWLRGGGQYYFKFSRNLSATAQSATYTVSSQSVSPTSTAQNTIWSSASGSSIQYNDQTISTTNMYTPVLYDWNNTAYFIDPASTSNLVGLTVANTITGSVSGNAVTAGGLAVHSARNDEANKIVRTDSNGYIQAGWINTTSGDNGTTAIDRIYASSDAYIRYYTPANFRTVLDVPTRGGSGASGSWGISITGNAATATTATGLNSSNYISRVGSSGNYNTDFQNTPAGTVRHLGDDASATNNPGGTWWFVDNYRHSNGSNYWGTQVAWGWEDQANKLATRNITGGTFGSWVYYLNSGNYSSYAIARGGDTVDGITLFRSNKGATSTVGSSNTYALQTYSSDAGAAGMSFHRGGYYAVNMGLDPDNVFRIGGWSASANRLQLDMSGNLTLAGVVDATQFRDSANTAYYVDPASTSILNLVRTRNTFGERATVTSAASTTIDTNFNVTELTMSASITTLTLSNIQASTIVHMWTIVTVGNGTAYSITWPAAIKWPGGTAPTITSTNTKRDIYQFVTYDGGTNIYAIIVGQNL